MCQYVPNLWPTKLCITVNLVGILTVTYFGSHVTNRGMAREWEDAQHWQRDDHGMAGCSTLIEQWPWSGGMLSIDIGMIMTGGLTGTESWQPKIVDWGLKILCDYLPTVQEAQCSCLHLCNWEINPFCMINGALSLPERDLNVQKHTLQSPNSAQCQVLLSLWWQQRQRLNAGERSSSFSEERFSWCKKKVSKAQKPALNPKSINRALSRLKSWPQGKCRPTGHKQNIKKEKKDRKQRKTEKFIDVHL